MIDIIIYSKVTANSKIIHEITIYFDTGRKFILSADSLNGLLSHYDSFMAPIEYQFETLSSYQAAVRSSQEDTQVIYL